MIVALQTERLATPDQVRAFVEGNEAVDLAGPGRRSTYELIGRVLGRFGYRAMRTSRPVARGTGPGETSA